MAGEDAAARAVALGRRGGRGLDSRQVGERRRRGGARAIPSVAVSLAAKAELESVEDEPRPPKVRRESRFGATFGTAVHRAIALALEKQLPVPDAVARAAREAGLTERLAEAEEDVSRSIAALRGGTARGNGGSNTRWRASVRTTRFPVGSIDFIAERNGELAIVDFKPDQAPAELAHVPEYVAQIASYSRLMGGRARTALLFTGEGRVRWT